jgi:sugar O-acyltransferase (sialic acid O-acetyltransferase NeuD family)
MKRLLIVGAGGFGRESLGWILAIPPGQRDWEVAGFLDSDLQALDGFAVPYEVIDDPEVYPPADNDVFLCAIGDPVAKLRVCRNLQSRGAHFMTFIHPTAIVGPGCVMGEGCVLCPGAVITADVHLGQFVSLNVYATVGHDVVIGDGCTLNGHTDVTGCARLGEGVFMGSHAAVLPGAVVADYTVIGGGSVVMRRTRARATVMGVPARQIAGFEE